MIPDSARYHGIALREIIMAAGHPLVVTAINGGTRGDCFQVDGAVVYIKYSKKRLSPWQFTFTQDQLSDLAALERATDGLWTVLVCGRDGVLCISASELDRVLGPQHVGTGALRVSRSRNSQYRISGPGTQRPYVRARGVEPIINSISGVARVGDGTDS